MKGTILDYSVQNNMGVISGDDQQRYNFQVINGKAKLPLIVVSVLTLR